MPHGTCPSFGFRRCSVAAPDHGAHRSSPLWRRSRAARVDAAASSRSVTFSRDIAPILREQCVACHRPERRRAVSRCDVRDARARASLIARVTADAIHAAVEAGAGPRRLSQTHAGSPTQQVALIQRWVESGAPEGDPSERPIADDGRRGMGIRRARPRRHDAGGVHVACGRHRRDSFVRDPRAWRTRSFREGLEFHPATRESFTTRTSRSMPPVRLGVSMRKMPAPGFEGSSRDAKFPGRLLSRLDARPARSRVAGTTPGICPRGADLVVELHLTPTGKAERVQSSIGLFLSDRAPSRTPYMIRLGSQRIDIPAGAQAYVHHRSLRAAGRRRTARGAAARAQPRAVDQGLRPACPTVGASG